MFKKVIIIMLYDGKGREYKDLWIKLEKIGILDEKFFKYVWGFLYDYKEIFVSLIEIMEKFSLLCVWLFLYVSKEYFVLFMLMLYFVEDII